ncbi:T9SS type A sorting domain-containing protein [bacterium]|nr:T9SS type A sorting domain-containing protein [bacterium]
MQNVKIVTLFALFLLFGVSAAMAAPVTFQVDMSVQIDNGTFDPNVQDVVVRGDFNGWAGNEEMLTLDVDNIWLGTFEIENGVYGFKFVIVNTGDIWESDIDNRPLVVEGIPVTLPVVYFNNEEPAGTAYPYEIDFTVDMSVMIDLGSFDPNTDGVIIRGGAPEIGNWGGYTAMAANGDGTYSVTINFASLEVGVPLEYKFVIDDDNDQADPVTWEEPPGGNRVFIPTGDEPDDGNDGDLDITMLTVYFSDNVGSLSEDMLITFELDGRAAILKHNDVGIPGVMEDEIEWFIVTGPWDSWEWTPGAYGTVTLLDNGVGADEVAGDSVFSAEYILPAGSDLNFPYKYGANGYDNEAGFGANYFIELPDEPELRLDDTFGSIGDWYDDWMPPAYPMATIAQIQTGVFQPGEQVMVHGVITQGHGTIHTTYVDVYVQDDSGYGIMMYASDPGLGQGLDRGDEIIVTAEIDQYYDTTELVNWLVEVVSDDNPLPAPMTWDTGDFDDQVPYEGVWAELTGELMTDPGQPGDTYNLMIDDGTGEATVRMYGDANIDLTMYSAGDWVTFRGTVDTYGGVCQLQPSENVDVEPFSNAPATLTVTPQDNIIPANGGTLVYDVHLVSSLPGSYPNVMYWTAVELPNGSEYGPLYQQPFTLTPFMDVTLTGLTQTIPPNAPAGNYTFIARAGYPTQHVTGTFAFSKEGTTAGVLNMDEWTATGWEVASDAAEIVTLPDEFELGAAYPNPFNPSTTIRVALPEASDLSVSVFNVMGQQVAELANSRYVAGEHTLTFDASNLSSGLYFVRAMVPGQLNATQKVMLVR